jgi:hypothetical protein
MNALPNPIPPSPNHPPSSRPSEVRHKWYLELLETCRALAGLPVLVSLIVEAFTPDTLIIGTYAAIAVAIALILRFFPKLRHMLKPHKGYAFWTALPWFLSAALTAILIFKILPDRAVNQSSLLANKWLKWQRELEEVAGQCSKDTEKAAQEKDTKKKDRDEKARNECWNGKLAAVIAGRPHPAQEGIATGLASDLMAGQLMLADGDTRSVLGGLMSIDEKFLGSGRSQPRGETDYKAASVPEYLVPNLTDKSTDVWVWKLDRGRVPNQTPIMERTLHDVLLSVAPEYNADFKGNWDSLKDHMKPNDPRPILVRFALLDPQKYSKCLGRTAATRVFMSNLGELAQRTVDEAARSTGSTVPEKSDDRALMQYIWVYAPTEENQAVPATWSNVLANFGAWTIAEPCQTTN